MTQIKFTEDKAREITARVRFGNIKTRDGNPVRIVCWNAKGQQPIVGLIDFGDFEMPMKYTAEGKSDTRDYVTMNTDLVIETEGGEA
jgi:hypothetical protein